MPWEYIGACGKMPEQLPYSRRPLIRRINLAVSYIGITCGWPPEGCELGVAWHQQRYAFRPLVGLHWEEGRPGGPPRDYIVNAMQALAQFASAVDWAKLWPEKRAGALEEQSEEQRLAAVLREIPAKKLADELAGKFSDACEEQGRRLLGEAPWMDFSSDLDTFSARLWDLDPVKFVTKVHALALFDLRDLDDLAPYEVALAILQAYAPE